MILEDDHPIRFTIPRKTEIKGKPASERMSVELDSKGKASPKQPKEPGKHVDEPKKKTKAKSGKAIDLGIIDPVVQSSPEEREDDVGEDVGGGEQICLSPDTNQDVHIPGMLRT